jgi:ribosomal protein L21E
MTREVRRIMAGFEIGDTVRVAMPRGKNTRGVMGVHVMFTTSPEAKFDGAVGTVTDIKPDGTHNIPLYLVDFKGHDNRTAIPWTAQWFRENWIQYVDEPPKAGKPIARPTSATMGEEVYSQPDKVEPRPSQG